MTDFRLTKSDLENLFDSTDKCYEEACNFKDPRTEFLIKNKEKIIQQFLQDQEDAKVYDSILEKYQAPVFETIAVLESEIRQLKEKLEKIKHKNLIDWQLEELDEILGGSTNGN